MLWQWELRDAKVLPRALQPGAMSRKKALHKARAPPGCTQCGAGRLAGDMKAGPVCYMRHWGSRAFNPDTSRSPAAAGGKPPDRAGGRVDRAAVCRQEPRRGRAAAQGHGEAGRS